MAQFIELQAKEDVDKSGDETNEEEEEDEATESDIGFIAPDNTPEKLKEMSELEKMDSKLEKSAKKKSKSRRKLASSDEEDKQQQQEYDLVIVENKVDEEGSTPPQPKKKQKTNSIPPPPSTPSSDDEETSIIKTRTEMKCPICPNFLNSGYTKKDGRYFMFCKGESCCMSYFDEGSAGGYVVKAKKDVLKKFKHPNPPIRCDCDVPTKLVWLRYNITNF